MRRATLKAGIAMDLFDAGAVLFAARQGMPNRAAHIGVVMAGSAAFFAAVGPILLRRIQVRWRRPYAVSRSMSATI
ncbi:hypothetical protein GCM10011591_42400 [Nocardia camponoti]|uniref:Uncharacterized protein n=1 Tax=Nocardia camponoti TaxID=1616106 RepID=A0A917QS88_9NOCA|nr:hypothetical protein GCM10011591_42400 [Nocardia camponoti]